MGVYAWQIKFEDPKDEYEIALYELGIDPWQDYSYKYESSSSGAPHTEPEAYDLAKELASRVQFVFPQLEIYLEKVRFCGCCPTEVYERKRFLG